VPSVDADGYIPLADQRVGQCRSDHQKEGQVHVRIAAFLSSARLAIWQAGLRARARLGPLLVVREILRESCSLLFRIRTLCEAKPYLYGLRFGPAADDLWSGRNHERIHACILDMRAITKFRPWATYWDRQLIVEGWLSGAKWGLGETRIPYVDILRNDPLASASPAERDSMPRPAVRQDSTRDLLAELPLQALRDELARRDRSCTTQSKESRRREDSLASSSTHSSGE
jgi:hypothetical protein